ncbi:MAG: hypothetical protein GY798_31560 [Hyphomicrobiales bacterium]|nr:hypothetical protein [Hyphomicrobiales bacterium]
MIVSKGVDFATADLAAAAKADDPEEALFALFFIQADTVIGSLSTDHLYSITNGAEMNGRGGDDHLFGGAGKQTLKGGNGNDTLDGWRGKDTYKGGSGEDTFFFTDRKLKTDTIKDFSHKDDQIILDDAVFSAIGLGQLNTNSFRIGKKATDDDDHVIYSKKAVDYITIRMATAESIRPNSQF